jgi:hypothetical protein
MSYRFFWGIKTMLPGNWFGLPKVLNRPNGKKKLSDTVTAKPHPGWTAKCSRDL